MKKALHFGAGNIGRGFIGQLLSESGYEVVFVDVAEELVRLLNTRREYPLRLVSPDGGKRDLHVAPVRAVSSDDVEGVRAEFAAADLVSTGVGANVLPLIAPLLAAGIAARSRHQPAAPIDILLCENQWHAATFLRDHTIPHLDAGARDYFDAHVGLVETVIGRMVPRPTPAHLAEDPLLLVTEPYAEFPCARAMFRGTIPAIVGLQAVDNFAAYEARKLYLHNAGHAALAYLGAGRYLYIYECVGDAGIRSITEAALAEAGAALTARYGFDPPALADFTNDLMARFASRALGDTVFRVAHDPARKLRPGDRLIGAASLCLEEGIVPNALATVIVAALAYHDPADPGSLSMRDEIADAGAGAFLSGHCGLAPDSPLRALILAEYRGADVLQSSHVIP